MGENDSQGEHELTVNQLYRGLMMSNNLDMKALLYKVFSVDWASAAFFFARTTPDMRNPDADGRYYKEFIKWFTPSRNWRCIVEWTSAVRKYLGDTSLWHGMAAEEIIKEIRSCPEECRRAVDFLLRKYRSACEAYLIDIAPSSEMQTYFIDRFQDPRPLAIDEVPRRPSDEDFGHVDGWPTITNLLEGDPGEQQSYCVLWIQSKPFTAEEVASRIRLFEKKAWGWGFCCFLDEREKVSIRILMERMFTIQRIRALLSDADGAAAEQLEASAAADRDKEPVREQAVESAMKQRKPRGAKQLAIEFIKERIASRSEYMRLSEMKQGKNFKEIKVKLWNEFQESETEKSKSITIETFHSYVSDALKEICPSRKQTSD
jgi:hypothetical protein